VYPAVRFILNDYRPGKYLAFGIPLWVSQTVMPVMWLVLGIRFMLQGFKNLIPGNTNLHSSGDRGGSEEPHPQAGTRAYVEVRRGERRSDNEGIRMKANWYKRG